VFERYLATSAAWRAAPRDGRERIDAESRVEGNEGITAAISAREGAIGAVELSYAVQARLPVASLRNAVGAFIAPSVASTTAAATAVLTPAVADTIPGIVGAPAADAYPVVALTRISADAALGDATRGAHFVAFVRWALREGASSAVEIGYAPLPEAVSAAYLRRLDALRPGSCPTPRSAP
jgi:phosphate transport system substrate-binding protein